MAVRADGDSWSLVEVDGPLVEELVPGAPEVPDLAGGDRGAAIDELVKRLKAEGALSERSIAEEPIEREQGAKRRLWRLYDATDVWRAHRDDGSLIELVVAAGSEVLLMSRPGASSKPADLFMSEYFKLSRSDPYARADFVIEWVVRRAARSLIELAPRDPRVFDRSFREHPEEALFELGFSLESQAPCRFLTRVLGLYDLQQDYLDRPLPPSRPIVDAHLVALWTAVGSAPNRPVILLLLSVDDELTERRMPRLQAAAEAEGYTLLPIYAASRWVHDDPVPERLFERLEEAFTSASGPVSGLVVHYGAAFSSDPAEYRSGLSAFRARHPEVLMATEGLSGQGGELEGIQFDPPQHLEFLLRGLGF